MIDSVRKIMAGIKVIVILQVSPLSTALNKLFMVTINIKKDKNNPAICFFFSFCSTINQKLISISFEENMDALDLPVIVEIGDE